MTNCQFNHCYYNHFCHPQITFPLTVSGLHQLGVAVLWRLSLGGGAGARASLHLDPVAGGGVVGVAGDIWRGRVVLWV